MRVATIFTGVAAATVGMTQVANAQGAAYPASALRELMIRRLTLA